MVFTIMTTFFPIGKSSEVAKNWIKSLQKYPPDASLSKTLAIGVNPTKDGIKVVIIGEVAKGKYVEALLRGVRSTHEFMSSVEGFRYEIETFMDITEAMPIVGMEAPEER
ncbi:MAG: hypothetical protein ACFFFT_10640 [Candidatus Thorarchaeota archaeon]